MHKQSQNWPGVQYPLKSSICLLVLEKYFQNKNCEVFLSCMSEHMIYIKNVTNMTKTLHQNVTNVTKQNIASKEIPTIEFQTKCVKLFVNMLPIICVLLNKKIHKISGNFDFEVILVQKPVLCEVTNVTNRCMGLYYWPWRRI